MDRMLVAVEGPQGRVDVAVPSGLPIFEVIPIVLQVFGREGEWTAGASAWGLAWPGQAPMPLTRSLVELGVMEGDILHLLRLNQQAPAASPAPGAPMAAIQTPPEPAPEVPAMPPEQPSPEPVPAELPPSPQPAPPEMPPDPEPVPPEMPPGSEPEPPARQPEPVAEEPGAVITASRPSQEEVAAPAEPQVRARFPERVALIDRLLAVRDAVLSPSAASARSPGRSGDPSVPARDFLSRPQPRSALERAREAWLTTDYLRRLELAIAAPRLKRCATIAVVSPKGGVGKTTTAVLLGTLLAMIRRDRIVAIDTNPDYGTLGRSLVPQHPVFVDDLLNVLEHPALTVTLLDQSLGRSAHGLMVLPSPLDPERMERLDEDSYERVIRRLQQLVGVIILDCGPGLHHPATRAALATADQVILVSDAEPMTAGLVADAARRLDLAGTPYLMVVNKLEPKRSRLDLEGLERHLPSRNRVRVIPAQDEAAVRVARGDFDWSKAPSSWQEAGRELALALVAEWDQELTQSRLAE